MAHNLLKAEQIAQQALGLLNREILLPALCWRNPVGNFHGAAGDTVTVRVPGRTAARTSDLRPTRTPGTSVHTYDELTELSIDVTLDKRVYNAIRITDEQMTLDIDSFGEQLTAPQVRAVVEGVENEVASLMTGATHADTLVVDPTKPANAFVDARKTLNDQNVPVAGRVAVVGSAIEATLLKSDQLQRVDYSGSDSALRDAQVGRIAGLDIFTSNALPEDFGAVFHRTAFVLNIVPPVVPTTSGGGAAVSSEGLSIRWVRDYDFEHIQDRSLFDLYLGKNTVVDPTIYVKGSNTWAENTENKVLRSVELTLGS